MIFIRVTGRDEVAVLRHGHHGEIRGLGLVHGRAWAHDHCGGFWD